MSHFFEIYEGVYRQNTILVIKGKYPKIPLLFLTHPRNQTLQTRW